MTVNNIRGCMTNGYTGIKECAEGYKEWFLNGKLHRKDGPAIQYVDGTTAWFLNGIEYTKPNYYKELFHRGLITEEECFLELLD